MVPCWGGQSPLVSMVAAESQRRAAQCNIVGSWRAESPLLSAGGVLGACVQLLELRASGRRFVDHVARTSCVSQPNIVHERVDARWAMLP